MLYCYYFPIIIVIIYIYYSTIRFTHFTHRKLFQKASMVPVNMVIQDCVVVFLFLCFFYSLMKGLISVTNCQQTALQLCLITLRTATPASAMIQPKVNKIDQSNPHPQYSEIQSVGTGLSWWTNKSLLKKLPPDLQSCSCHWITNRMGGLFFFRHDANEDARPCRCVSVCPCPTNVPSYLIANEGVTVSVHMSMCVNQPQIIQYYFAM